MWVCGLVISVFRCGLIMQQNIHSDQLFFAHHTLSITTSVLSHLLLSCVQVLEQLNQMMAAEPLMQVRCVCILFVCMCDATCRQTIF